MASTQVNELVEQLVGLTKVDDHDHDHDHDEHGDDRSVVTAKATAMGVLLLSSLFFGLIPFKLAKMLKWSDPNSKHNGRGTIINLLLFFGGGVLLCTTFMHLLPEVGENVKQLQRDGALPNVSFHFAELLMCLGFFIMYLVEEIVHIYIRRHQKCIATLPDTVNAVAVAATTLAAGANIMEHNAKENGQINGGGTNRKKNNDLRNSSISTADLITNDLENQKHESSIEEGGTDDINCPPAYTVHSQHHQHHHTHSHIPAIAGDDLIVSSLRGLLIVLALSVHELFEGLAVGLEASASNVWYMFGAVAAHKLVLAFCVGVELVVTKTRPWLACIYIATFAIVSPLGIGIGILVSDSSQTVGIVSVILQGLASGTLLYVVFFEVLSKEKSGILQYVAVLVGFFLMFGLQFLTGHEHSHGNGGDDDDHDHDHDDHDHAHTLTDDNEQILLHSKINLIKQAADQLSQTLRPSSTLPIGFRR